MLQTVKAIMKKDNRVEFLEPVDIPDNTTVLVTLLKEEDEEGLFWMLAGSESLKEVWDNKEDDIYGQLLKR